MEDPARIVLYWVILVFSCVFHECAHVWSALKMGDPTGKLEGRLTLNPIPHFDLFWTFLLPVFTLMSQGFPIGGPKPAPVNPLNFKNPRLGDLWASLAGPASNFLLAASGLGLLWALHAAAPSLVPPDSWNALVFFSIFMINMVLGLANLIPVPPLDGSRFLHFIAGRSLDRFMEFVDRSLWASAILIYFAFRFLAPVALGPFLLMLYPILDLLFGSDYAVTLLNSFRGR
jgi:Zn-dependent protease